MAGQLVLNKTYFVMSVYAFTLCTHTILCILLRFRRRRHFLIKTNSKNTIFDFVISCGEYPLINPDTDYSFN